MHNAHVDGMMPLCLTRPPGNLTHFDMLAVKKRTKKRTKKL